MNNRRTLITAGAAALLILGITGCAAPGAAVDGVLDPIFGGAAASATPTATPTPEPLAGDLDANGKIDTWEAEQLAKGQYAMADGSTVALVKGEPIPDAVKADIVATTVGLKAGKASRSPQESLRAENVIWKSIRAREATLGLRIITVLNLYREDFGGPVWCVGGDAADRDSCFRAEADALAYATKWVGGQTQYTIINFG